MATLKEIIEAHPGWELVGDKHFVIRYLPKFVRTYDGYTFIPVRIGTAHALARERYGQFASDWVLAYLLTYDLIGDDVCCALDSIDILSGNREAADNIVRTLLPEARKMLGYA